MFMHSASPSSQMPNTSTSPCPETPAPGQATATPEKNDDNFAKPAKLKKVNAKNVAPASATPVPSGYPPLTSAISIKARNVFGPNAALPAATPHQAGTEKSSDAAPGSRRDSLEESMDDFCVIGSRSSPRTQRTESSSASVTIAVPASTTAKAIDPAAAKALNRHSQPALGKAQEQAPQPRAKANAWMAGAVKSTGEALGKFDQGMATRAASIAQNLSNAKAEINSVAFSASISAQQPSQAGLRKMPDQLTTARIQAKEFFKEVKQQLAVLEAALAELDNAEHEFATQLTIPPVKVSPKAASSSGAATTEASASGSATPAAPRPSVPPSPSSLPKQEPAVAMKSRSAPADTSQSRPRAPSAPVPKSPDSGRRPDPDSIVRSQRNAIKQMWEDLDQAVDFLEKFRPQGEQAELKERCQSKLTLLKKYTMFINVIAGDMPRFEEARNYHTHLKAAVAEFRQMLSGLKPQRQKDEARIKSVLDHIDSLLILASLVRNHFDHYEKLVAPASTASSASSTSSASSAGSVSSTSSAGSVSSTSSASSASSAGSTKVSGAATTMPPAATRSYRIDPEVIKDLDILLAQATQGQPVVRPVTAPGPVTTANPGRAPGTDKPGTEMKNTNG
jgi:hypothetical protein